LADGAGGARNKTRTDGAGAVLAGGVRHFLLASGLGIVPSGA